MTIIAPETHDAEPGIATTKLRMHEEFEALKSRSSDVLSSPYVLGGAAVGIAAAGYALVRRRKATPRPIAPKRREHRVDMLKVAGFLVSMAASLASVTDDTKADADAGRSATKAVPARPEALSHDVGETQVKDAQPDKTAAKRTAFEQTSSSWLGRQWEVCVAAANAWSDDYAPSMGAALSYYMLFSLAPLLVIVIAIAGLVFGHDAAQGAIIAQLGGIMGKEGATAVQNLLQAAHEPSTGIVASIIGGVVLLIGATAMFAELQSDLDRIWQVPEKNKPSGIWGWLRSRVLSFGLVLGVAFMLMISLVVSAVLAASGEWLGGGAAESVIANGLNFIASLAIFTLLFALIYKIMPSAKISWHDVWMGSAVTALLFNVGKSLIGLYLAKSSVASGFGAAGSIVFLVAWFYYSAQIFLFGAEYTWVYANSKQRSK